MPTITIFTRPTAAARSWLLGQLRDETIGGALLIVAAAIAFAWANSPWREAYAGVVGARFGPAALHLDLSFSTWAADGLLAVFFFVVGLELKHELVHGSLADPARAAVPIAAALGGMAVPALVYAGINSVATEGDVSGWGIPMATDIAFALAVLAVVGRGVPLALRAFLLTSAVVDDLGAIIVIAVFYSHGFDLVPLLAALALLGAYAFAQHRRWRSPLLYVPLAIGAWWCVHESGVHATIAGVALGLLTRVRADAGEHESPADRLTHLLHPVSAGIAVPVFAFTAAGVTLQADGVDLVQPVSIGIAAGLLLGKPIGIFITAWVVARFTRATLAADVRWRDVAGIGVLSGIGFTVALLVAELAFAGTPQLAPARLAILAASLLAAALAALVLRSGRVVAQA